MFKATLWVMSLLQRYITTYNYLVFRAILGALTKTITKVSTRMNKPVILLQSLHFRAIYVSELYIKKYDYV